GSAPRLAALARDVRLAQSPSERAGVSRTERGRFELPLPLRADRFSKPAHSTTLPPLRANAVSVSGAACPVKFAVFPGISVLAGLRLVSDPTRRTATSS